MDRDSLTNEWYDILERSSVEDIVSLFRTNKYFNTYDNDVTWGFLLNRDFPGWRLFRGETLKNIYSRYYRFARVLKSQYNDVTRYGRITDMYAFLEFIFQSPHQGYEGMVKIASISVSALVAAFIAIGGLQGNIQREFDDIFFSLTFQGLSSPITGWEVRDAVRNPPVERPLSDTYAQNLRSSLLMQRMSASPAEMQALVTLLQGGSDVNQVRDLLFTIVSRPYWMYSNGEQEVGGIAVGIDIDIVSSLFEPIGLSGISEDQMKVFDRAIDAVYAQYNADIEEANVAPNKEI